MKRIFAIAFAVLTALAPFVLPQPALPFRGVYNAGTNVICPPNVTSVFVECWGNGGLVIANPSIPCNGGGGGAYASALVTVVPGKTYRIENFADWVQFAEEGTGRILVRAESGKQSLVTFPTVVAKGGQAANCIGTTKFSGGDGGITFAGRWLGAGGLGATPKGNGSNGANGTNGADAIGAKADGADATILQAGSGGGGTNSTTRGGKGLCRIN